MKNKKKLQARLTKKGIFSKVYFNPIYLTSFYKNNFHTSHLPITEKISKQILVLPIYPNMINNEKEKLKTLFPNFLINV
jgi:dTDP-4-amino-4,6-dideoxygalactose transaminase